MKQVNKFIVLETIVPCFKYMYNKEKLLLMYLPVFFECVIEVSNIKFSLTTLNWSIINIPQNYLKTQYMYYIQNVTWSFISNISPDTCKVQISRCLFIPITIFPSITFSSLSVGSTSKYFLLNILVKWT